MNLSAMKRVARGVWCLTVLAALSGGLLGCTENNVTLFVQGIPAPIVEEECIVANSADAPMLFSGVLDKGIARAGYTNVLLIGNQLAPRGNAATLRPESSRVQFYEAEVTVFNFQGVEFPTTPYRVPVSGFVEPATGTQPSYGLVEITMIDSATAELIAVDPLQLITLPEQQETVVVRVKVFGTTLGGLEVETGAWDFPVRVCQSYRSADGAVLPCLSCDPNGQTISADAEESEDENRPCNAGQDIEYKFCDRYAAGLELAPAP